ncbi:MAG: InlB B-repeat-containing protein [Bacilli bacterium]
MKSSKIIKSLFSLVVFFGLLFAFVGCYDAVNYKVTFESEGEVVASVVVAKGATFPAEQVPANPEKEGYDFVGWYNGSTLFDPNEVVNDNIRYVAKFEEQPEVYTLTFVCDEVTVKTVEVQEGEKIDIASVPADPVKKAYEFVGWFNEKGQFNEEAKVYASATYYASFERTDYVVTFGEQEVLVPVGETLSLEGVEAPVQEGAYFAGWVSDGVFASEGLEITADTTFEALFVTASSFEGVWGNSDGTWFVISESTVTNGIYGSNGKVFAFNPETGALEYDASSLYINKHSFVVTATGLNYVHYYWDDIYEEMTEEVVELTRAVETGYEGTYRADNSSYIDIIEGGYVTRYEGGQTTKGIVVTSEEGTVINYSTSSSSYSKSVAVVFDEFGNLQINGKIYVKNSEAFAYLYQSSNPTVYFFTVAESEVVIVSDSGKSYYATYEGVREVGQILTVSYAEKELVLQVTGTTSYVAAGSEQGSYTYGENTLVLDGFGTATVNGKEAAYTINGANVIVADGHGYKVNSETKTYEELTKDSVNTGVYVYNDNTKYTLVLDGFGGATLYYSTYEYKGVYKLTSTSVTISNCNYYANGTWTFEENGQVLAKDGKVYLLEGATLVDVREEMNGVYGDAGEVIVSTGKIVYAGVEYTLTYNYNGSKATFGIKHTDESIYGVQAEFTDVYTIYKKENGNLFVEAYLNTWDEYGEGPESTYQSAEYAPYVAQTLDAFAGTWVGTNSYGNTMTYVINGDGTGTLYGNAITYTISGNVLSFTYNWEDYTLTGDPSTGKLTAQFTYDYEWLASFVVTKQSEEASGDAYQGTWTGTLYGSTVTIVFNGDGTGTFGDQAITYTISGNTLTFEYSDGTYTLVGDPSTNQLTANWTYDSGYEDGPSYKLTR